MNTRDALLESLAHSQTHSQTPWPCSQWSSVGASGDVVACVTWSFRNWMQTHSSYVFPRGLYFSLALLCLECCGHSVYVADISKKSKMEMLCVLVFVNWHFYYDGRQRCFAIKTMKLFAPKWNAISVPVLHHLVMAGGAHLPWTGQTGGRHQVGGVSVGHFTWNQTRGAWKMEEKRNLHESQPLGSTFVTFHSAVPFWTKIFIARLRLEMTYLHFIENKMGIRK